MSARSVAIIVCLALVAGGAAGAYATYRLQNVGKSLTGSTDEQPTPSASLPAEKPYDSGELEVVRAAIARDEEFDMAEAMVIRELTDRPAKGGTVEGFDVPVVQAHQAVSAALDLHEQRLLEAADPAAYRERLRNDVSAAWNERDATRLARVGEFLFQYDLGAWNPPPRKLRRVHRGALGGPDAFRCASCHWVPVRGGGGALADNTFFDGDGKSTSSALVRNPPSLNGAGLVELLAAEMSRDLQALVAEGVTRAREEPEPIRVDLSSKGVSFGSVEVHPNGFVDTSGVVGVDEDLVVKPFGWKGTTRTLRESVTEALHLQLGLPPEQLGSGGVEALVTFVVSLEIPKSMPPWLPDQQLRWETGRQRFEELGCADCHRPYLVLEDPVYRLDDLTIDLAQLHGLERDTESGGWRVWLFSDLKRHDMGEGLADHHSFLGVPRTQFQTPPLWGMDGTAPYLHDGRAADSIDATISQHGGEASEIGETFWRLPVEKQGEIRTLLRTLSREPRMRVMGP